MPPRHRLRHSPLGHDVASAHPNGRPIRTEETTVTDVIATPDLAAIKQRQQATWASGDYHMIGTQVLIVSELLIGAGL